MANECIALDLDVESYFIFNRSLGKGSYGEVYDATVTSIALRDLSPELPERVAIKKIPLKPTDMDTVYHEIQILKRLQTPRAIHYYGCYVTVDTLYIVMDLIEGESLRQALRRLSFPQVLTVIRELALAIRDIHRINIVHRDLKHSNIMVEVEYEEQEDAEQDVEEQADVKQYADEQADVDEPEDAEQDNAAQADAEEQDIDDNVKLFLVDFGLSCYKDIEQYGTCDKKNVGTQRYYDKKAHRNIGSLKLSDWWSFGQIVVELYVGQSPYDMEKDKFKVVTHEALEEAGVPHRFQDMLIMLTDPKRSQKDRPTEADILSVFAPGSI